MQPGTYLVRAERETFKGGSAGTGTKQVGVTLRIVSSGPGKGEKIPWQGSMASVEATQITRETLMLLGWDGTSSMRSMNGLGTVDAEAIIAWESFDGENGRENRLKVKAIRAPGAFFFKGGEATDSDFDEMDAMMKEAAGAPRVRRGGGGAPRQSRQQTSGDWDGTGRYAPPSGGGGGAQPGGQQSEDGTIDENDIPFVSSAFAHDPMLKVR